MTYPEPVFDPLPLGFQARINDIFHHTPPTAVLLNLESFPHPVSDALSRWLHPDELKQLAGYRYEKRYREWLGGRICAKQCLRLSGEFRHHETFKPDRRQCAVASDNSGRPYFADISGVNYNFPHLSISHSREYAAAAVCRVPCGIDIQHTTDSLLRVKERFCVSEEEKMILSAAPQLAEISRLALLWSGKEAVKKMLSLEGIPDFHDLLLDQVQVLNNCEMTFLFLTKKRYDQIPVAATMLSRQYALALCC